MKAGICIWREPRSMTNRCKCGYDRQLQYVCKAVDNLIVNGQKIGVLYIVVIYFEKWYWVNHVEFSQSKLSFEIVGITFLIKGHLKILLDLKTT